MGLPMSLFTVNSGVTGDAERFERRKTLDPEAPE